MGTLAHFYLAYFILSGSYVVCANADYKKYVSLISDVHKHYRTSSVFFIFAKNNRCMQEYAMVHLLARTFSDKGVVTLIINFVNLDTRLTFYRKQMNRPLVVVLLKSVSDIAEFNENIRDRNKSYPIWLVIFHGVSGDDFCGYCDEPIGNKLGLRFDTLMLVVCCDEPTIQQWWSVHDNLTEIDDFGTWTADDRLQLVPTAGLYSRRRDVLGTDFRVVVVSHSALIHDHGNRIGGFFGQVLRELKTAMNFTIKRLIRVDEFGGYNWTAKSWSGAVGLLVRGDADLAIADLTITNERMDAIDFTTPLMISRSELFIKEPDVSDVQWTAYFEAFTLEIWGIIMVLLVTTPVLLAVIKVRGGSISVLALGIENYLYVWGIFCQQGLFEFPTETPLRIAYFSIFVSALVVSAAYSASLISFLTLSSSSLPFSTMIGFANDGSYKLIVYKNSSDYDFFIHSNDSTFMKMAALMKPPEDLPLTTREGWDQVCSERVALYTTNVEMRTMKINCNVVAIKTGRVDSLAMGLPVDSQYTNVVNYHIQRFRANGVFNRLKRLYERDTKDLQSDASYDVVRFSGIAPVVSALAGGIILALVVLFCEKMYYSVRKNGRSDSGRGESGPQKPKLHKWFNFGKLEQPEGKEARFMGPGGQIGASSVGYYP